MQDSPGRTLLGTLFVTYRQPRRISTEERSIASGLANLATLALANARLHAQTLRSLHAAEHQAGTDELTGLSNRRVVEEHLQTLTERAGERHEALSVLVLDLDEFKEINDRHGHGIGDDCLRAVGRTIATSLRPGDRAGRVGGEEFLVVLPSTGAKGAWLVAERLRARIAEIPTAAGVELSASFGVASYPLHAPERDRARARGRHGDVLGQGDRAQPQRPLQPRPGAGAHREHPSRPGEQRGLPGLRARPRRGDGRPRPLHPRPLHHGRPLRRRDRDPPGPGRRPGGGDPDRGAAARHRQGRGVGRRPAQARPAHRPRERRDAPAPRDRGQAARAPGRRGGARVGAAAPRAPRRPAATPSGCGATRSTWRRSSWASPTPTRP